MTTIWSITQLFDGAGAGGFEGGIAIGAGGVNNSGKVIGTALVSAGPGERAVVWDVSTPESYTLMSLTGGNFYSFGTGINAAGKSCGYAVPPQGGSNLSTAYRWAADGTATVLTPLGGDNEARGYGINDADQVVGFSALGGSIKPVIWNGTTATALGTGSYGVAYGVNNVWQAVGFVDSDAATWNNSTTLINLLVGFSYDVNASGVVASGNTVYLDATDSGSAVSLPSGAQAFAITDAGLLVGEDQFGGQPAYWNTYADPTTLLPPLDTLGDYQFPFGEALDTSPDGRYVVGYINDGAGTARSVVWTLVDVTNLSFSMSPGDVQ